MSIQLPRIFPFHRQPQPAPAPAPTAGDIMQTRWGWYGMVRKVGQGGYSLYVLYRMQDGTFIKPYNASTRWVWNSEVVS